MEKTGPKSLLDITTTPGSGLERLAREARQRESLLSLVRKALDDDLRLHVTGCNLHEDGTLVVLADSPEWVARLRFEYPVLLNIEPAAGGPIQRVNVRVSGPDAGNPAVA